MRILASPAFANEKVNPYNALLYRGIETVVIETVVIETVATETVDSTIIDSKTIANKAIDRKTNNSKIIKPSVSEYSHKKALLGKYDIIHFHWPDGYINQHSLLKLIQRAFVFSLIILMTKLKGAKIVWTVHNIAPHDAYHPKLSRLFMDWFINRCNGLIFMSEASKTTFFNLHQPPATIQYAIIPHGHYRSSYPAAIDKAIAKTQLGLSPDKKILLFCGMIKPYKNINALIQTFSQAQLADYELVIAGNPDSLQLEKQLQQQKGNNSSIHLFLRFIPDAELHVYLSAADVVILPYKSILNSGALLLALSFNKPVIAPHIGAFVALQQELGSQWVYSYEGDLQAPTLTTALYELAKLERATICPLENYDWNKLAASTVAFYQHLFLPPATRNQQVMS